MTLTWFLKSLEKIIYISKNHLNLKELTFCLDVWEFFLHLFDFFQIAEIKKQTLEKGGFRMSPRAEAENTF